MNDVDFGELVVRMVFSLGAVLALMYIAYRFIKHRQNGSSARVHRTGLSGLLGGVARSGRAAPRRGTRSVNPKRGLKIVARAGLSKSSSVIAVQFGDRVLLVGASEQAPPAVLAEIELSAWTELVEDPDDESPLTRLPVGTISTDVQSSRAPGAGAGQNRPSVIEALREMTARRG